MSENKTAERNALDIQLDAVASQVRTWLDWHKAHRDKEYLITDGDTSIMALPVPFWPSHSQFEAWIATFENARAALASRDTEIARLKEEVDDLAEQLEMRSPSEVEKNMQAIMRFNNELLARATAAEAEVAEWQARHAGMNKIADTFFDQFTEQFRARVAAEAECERLRGERPSEGAK